MRPPDEIVAIETIIQVPGSDPTKETFQRAGHIYVLQIGSGENCQVRNECLANLHASIEVHKQSAYITNYDRVMGTVVNGQRIHDRIKVRHGDEVKCGDVMLELGFLHPNIEGEKALPSDPKVKGPYQCNGCGIEWALHPKGCTNRAHWDSYTGKLGEMIVEERRRGGEKDVEIEGLTVQIARLKKDVEDKEAEVEMMGETAAVAGEEIEAGMTEILGAAEYFRQTLEDPEIRRHKKLVRWADYVEKTLEVAKGCHDVAKNLTERLDEDDKRDIETLRKERKTREMQFDAVVSIAEKALEGVEVPETTTAASSWTKILANQYRFVKAELEKLKKETKNEAE